MARHFLSSSGGQARSATSLAHLQERFGATLPYIDQTLVDRDQPGRG